MDNDFKKYDKAFALLIWLFLPCEGVSCIAHGQFVWGVVFIALAIAGLVFIGELFKNKR